MRSISSGGRRGSRRSRASASRCVRSAALAAGVVGLSEEALLIRREQLPRFLAGWYPYNLTLVDVPATPSAARVDEMIVVIGAATYDEPVLPALAGSRLLFSGHDDCYVALETTDRAVPAAVLGRLLALLVGSALVDTTMVEVTAPDVETVQRLIEESRHWVGELGAATPGSVTVDLLRHVRIVAARPVGPEEGRPQDGLRRREQGLAVDRGGCATAESVTSTVVVVVVTCREGRTGSPPVRPPRSGPR